MRIAALDDDEAQLEAIFRIITAENHTCFSFSSGKALISALRRESFDLLVLDWTVPDMSGLDIISWCAQNLADPPPVLLLTNRSTSADVVEGLTAGADDYIVKPIQPRVLAARITALLRRASKNRNTGKVEAFGDYVFDTAAETLQVAGVAITLTSKEFGLSLLLFQNLHRALSRAHILEVVWGRNPSLPTRTLDMHVSRVRAKLGLRPEQGFRLAPVYSFGYRLERMDACEIQSSLT